MLGNWHVRCGAGEKLEMTSNAYLLQTEFNHDMTAADSRLDAVVC